MHARAAAKLVKTASQFNCPIEIQYNNQVANAKDILEIMLLGLRQGSWIEIHISDDNASQAQQALSSIEALIGNYFGEGK